MRKRNKTKIYSTLIVLSIALITPIYYVYQVYQTEHDKFAMEKEEWTTFKKKLGKVKGYPSTNAELNKIGAQSLQMTKESSKKTDVNRKPASIKIPKREHPTFNGRRLIGNITQETNMDQIKFINIIKDNWKESLSEKLLKHRERKATLFIKNEKSVIKIYNGTARYLELVNITFLFEGDLKNSYKAFVDSETGEIIQTWSRTIHDKVGKKRRPLIPTGTL